MSIHAARSGLSGTLNHQRRYQTNGQKGQGITPNNVFEFSSFWGVLTLQKIYTKSSVLSPLYQLLHNSRRWQWGKDQDMIAVNTLPSQCDEKPIVCAKYSRIEVCSGLQGVARHGLYV